MTEYDEWLDEIEAERMNEIEHCLAIAAGLAPGDREAAIRYLGPQSFEEIGRYSKSVENKQMALRQIADKKGLRASGSGEMRSVRERDVSLVRPPLQEAVHNNR